MKGVILAGGENRRIPLLKGHIEINGQRIIDANIRLLKGFFRSVVISTNMPEFYFYCGAPMIGDLLRQRGPLTGIFSVLASAEADAVFAAACDMPFIKPELVSLLVARCSSQGQWDAVIPVFEGKPQPLPGIYSKNILNTAEERINKGLEGIRDMLTGLNVLFIKEEDIRSIDPDGRSFVNINTMEDYRKVVSASA